MQTLVSPKDHWNLYYILKTDQHEHPMPQHVFHQIQQKLAEILGTANSNVGCETP